MKRCVVFNKAIRREAHAFMGSFLESPLFMILPREDVFYCQTLMTFFQVGFVDEATVHHFRYPGNALDRQIEKFQRPTAVQRPSTGHCAEKSACLRVLTVLLP